MKPDTSLHRTLFVSLLLTAFLSIGGLGFFWMFREYQEYLEESRILKENYVNIRKERIRDEVEQVATYVHYMRSTAEEKLRRDIRIRVDEAIALAENLYETYRESKTSQEIGEMIREALRPIRFHEGRGYFFVHDMAGRGILLPFSPELEGKNLWDLQDSKGLYTIRRFTRLIREQGEGYLTWHWYKPGTTEHMSEKIGFAKYFEPLGWWIGTGDYTEDVEKDIQKEVLNWIRRIRFGEDGYIFVYTFDAITLAHYKPENIGLNQWEFTDSRGTKVLQELIRISQQEQGGYLEYVGTVRPSTGQSASKISFVKSVPDWRWMIGTGVYVDEIEKILAGKRLDLSQKIQRYFFCSVLMLSCLFLLVCLVSRYISKKVRKNFGVFSSFFDKSVTEYAPIRDADIFFSEFRRLADSANRMTAERNRIEAEMKKMEEELQRTRKMESLGRLAGGVAHDLNNVLSGTVSYPDLLLMEIPEDSPMRKQLLTIKKSGQKAAAIVQDLLSLARGGIHHQDVLNLNRIAEDYLESPEHRNLLAHHPRIRVISRLAPDLLNIRGSYGHLKKAVMNLVSNAAQSQREGGVITISTENRYVDRPVLGYDTIREGDYAVLRIEDQGPGISSEDIRQIFEPFYTKKVMGRSGTGLGMAVVWGTVHDHGGYIHVENLKEKGTAFELCFLVTREELSGLPQLPVSIAAYRGSGEQILVVDDMEDQREIAQLMLEKLGYRVHTAAGGEEAAAWMKENSADLVVLDMIMEPGIDGLETYKRMLQICPGQKAVIASGFAETERVKAARELGAGRYLRKPYTLENLGKAVKEELRGRGLGNGD
ncbi:MAG: cache domain-containing protein [Desulfobacterales bacterium]